MIGRIILSILTIDVIFITFMVFIYYRNKVNKEKMREESLEILFPMIKELVKKNDNKLRDFIYVPGNNFDYIERLFRDTYGELIQKLYTTNFSFNEVNHEEIEFRLRSYINSNILKELETIKNNKKETKKTQDINKVDITDYLYT